MWFDSRRIQVYEKQLFSTVEKANDFSTLTRYIYIYIYVNKDRGQKKHVDTAPLSLCLWKEYIYVSYAEFVPPLRFTWS